MHAIHLATTLALAGLASVAAAQGAEASGITPEQFAGVIREDTQRWSELIRAAGISAD
jgi:tripartite-type tricarboxylate transporter receptor subunit TctC